MVEVIEETLVQEVMVKVKEEMVEEVMGATQETKETVKNKTFLEAFHAFCDEENNDKSENEDTLGNDNHMSGENLIYPILTSQNSHRRHKLFSPRHSTDFNDFNISFDARTKNTLKKGKRLKQSKNRKSKIKYTFYRNTMTNNDYNVLYDHNSDLYIPIAPILNVDMLLKK